ncbi:MAG: AAA family ATPase [Elusimicrobia bacterium]|nr:AAA family ATPase [Elusimicrobiota bacterium]
MGFAAIRGQERAAAMLRQFLRKGRIPSALLFTGPDGVGKTLMAAEFAKALLCKNGDGCGACQDCAAIEKRIHPDVKVVDAFYQAALKEEDASKQKTLSVDTLRHLRKDIELGSMMGSWKVAIIPEAHAMAAAGANALLKVIEEPPPKTLWVLVTSRRELLPKTVLSRTFPVRFAPLPQGVVRDLLEERGVEAGAAGTLGRLCEGSVSRALALHEAGLPAPAADPFAGASTAGPEGQPRELHAARRKAELSLYGHEQALRLRLKAGHVALRRAVPALREIGALRQALHANADPGTILTLANLRMEGL